MSRKRLKVLLVIGGDSAESDVSISTGNAVFHALKQVGHEVIVVDPHRPDVAPTDDPGVFFDNASIAAAPPRIDDDVARARRGFVHVLSRVNELGCDVVLNALHGGVGEDGTFQAVMDYLKVPYTGSGPCASAVAMDKDMAKRLVSAAGVPVAHHITMDTSADEATIERQVMDTLSLPVVVKPNHEGSSVGVTLVRDRDALAEAIRRAREFPGPYLVEKFVGDTELTAAVMDGVELPLLEIRPKSGFYDYQNKYQPGSCEYLVPAPLDGDLTLAIKAHAQRAYRAIGCSGYARVDFRLSKSGEMFFLEVNTLPGLTANSLFPKAALAAGIDYPELVDRILQLSVAPNRI